MKCDLRRIDIRRGEEVVVQCARERHVILETRWGRLGLCGPCQLFVTAVMNERPQKGEIVEFENGTMGRKAPDSKVRFKRGFVVVDNFPES